MEKFNNKYRVESNRLRGWDYSSCAIYFITIVTANRDCIFGTIENGKMVYSAFGAIANSEWLASFDIRQELFLDEYVIMPNHIHAIVVIKNDDSLKGDNCLSVNWQGDMVDGVVNNQYDNDKQYVIESQIDADGGKSKNEQNGVDVHNDVDCLYNVEGCDGIGIDNGDNVDDWDDCRDARPCVSTRAHHPMFPTDASHPTHANPPTTTGGFQRKPKSISSFIAGYKSMVVNKIDNYIGDNNLNIPKYNRNHPLWQANYHDHIIRNDVSYQRIKNYIANNPASWDKDKLIGEAE